MADREKVASGLRHHARACEIDGDLCPYWNTGSCHAALCKDAFELIKEQESVKPEWRCGKAYCGACGMRLPKKKQALGLKYCGFCGREIKWNDK